MFSNIKRFGEGKHFLSRVNNFFFIVIEARFVEISKARVMAAERLPRFIYWQSLLPVLTHTPDEDFFFKEYLHGDGCFIH